MLKIIIVIHTLPSIIEKSNKKCNKNKKSCKTLWLRILQHISNYLNSTITNQFCLETIFFRVYNSFDYLMYPYYPAHCTNITILLSSSIIPIISMWIIVICLITNNKQFYLENQPSFFT